VSVHSRSVLVIADSSFRVFNTGSPYNVSAGQGGINLEKVVAHYHKINSDAEEKKAAALAAKEAEQK
jgi:hypothetical protein